MTSTQTRTKADDLRAYLLPHTIAHARSRSPYYREALRHAPADAGLDDLAHLPLLSKDDLQAHGDDMRTFSSYPDYLMYTSGTTGAQLEVPVYRSEMEAYDRFVIAAWRERLGELPLTLSVQRVGHGTHVVSPSLPTVPAHINYGIEQLVAMLRGSHWLNGTYVRVTNLEANVLNIRQITAELLDAGTDPKSFGLQTINLSGWYIPSHERAALAETWGALILDRYGVTEVHGDAKWCALCGYYHFDFTVIPEVLDVDSGEPIEEGIGEIVLTGLFPFNQAIPKIRYRLGDLVEARRTACGSSERGVRFLSRTRDAVRIGSTGTRYRPFSSEVAEALAALPDVRRNEKTGFLRFALAREHDDRLAVTIELTYHPDSYRSRTQELDAIVRTGLAARSVYADGVDVRFVGPGRIAKITKV